MTTISSELQTTATVELDEQRRRIARLIAVSSGSFSALIAIVATILAIVA